MSQVNTSSYLSRIRSIVPTACTAKAAHANRSKRDTLDEARQKVADKLRLNKAYFLDSASVDEPDLVYKEQVDGTFAVGIKYGNRWLDGVFDGLSFINSVAADELANLLEFFAVDAEAGLFDTQIAVIMQANVAAKNKK